MGSDKVDTKKTEDTVEQFIAEGESGAVRLFALRAALPPAGPPFVINLVLQAANRVEERMVLQRLGLVVFEDQPADVQLRMMAPAGEQHRETVEEQSADNEEQEERQSDEGEGEEQSKRD